MSSHAPRSQARLRCRSQPAAMSNSSHGRCYFGADGFGEHLVHEILSRLPVPDLLAAKQCCRSWRSIISCEEFRALYDHKSNNDAMVIGLNSSTNSFPFFQISLKSRNYTRQWDLALDRPIVGENSEWMLVGSYKSLLLFKEREVIRFCVANPLIRKCRLIPEPPVDKAESWRMRSVHMIVSGAEKKILKLLVFAVTLRSSVLSGPCFSMAYDSLTNGWKVRKLSEIRGYCSDFENNPEGICFSGENATHIRGSSSFSYDTETSVIEKKIEFENRVPDNYRFRALGLGIFEYQNNMYLLDAWRPHNNSMGKMFKISIWKANSTGREWMFSMGIDLVRDFKSISRESVVCYDQERYISVFPRDGSQMILADLHSESFRILGVNPVTLTWNRNSRFPRGDLRAFPIKPSLNCCFFKSP